MALDSTDTLKAIRDAFNDHDLDAIMRKMVMIGAICAVSLDRPSRSVRLKT